MDYGRTLSILDGLRIFSASCRSGRPPFDVLVRNRNLNNVQKGRDMSSKPTHEQAQLHLQVYDLRREERLRQARDWFQQNYHAETVEEAMRIAAPGTEGGRFFGMVIGYWEQACALLNYELLNEDLFFESSGEFFGVWEAVKPVLPQ